MNGFMHIYFWTLLCVVNFMPSTVVCVCQISLTVLYMWVCGVIEKRVVAEFQTPLLSALSTLYIVVNLDVDSCMP